MLKQTDDKNIVLIGMMGAGKTYIGGKLAKLLAHFTYVDIDKEIEKEQGLSIPEIFEKYSEDYFRKLEAEVIDKFSKYKNQIIATGGGAFENPENISKLKENGLVFYLKTSVEELFNRLEGQGGRPLLENNLSIETIRTILNKREKNYIRADFVIDTDKKQAYTILDDILKEYDAYVK